MALLGGSAGGAAVASTGAGLLLWLYVTRTFTPASAHVVKPLYFDYTQLQAVAATSLVSDSRLTAYAHNLSEANPKQVRSPNTMPISLRSLLWILRR